MKKLIILLFITLLLTSCQRNQVIHTHGIAYLENREKLIIVNKSNKNDAVLVLGQPATKGMDNNNLWIYIERTKTRGKLLKLGRSYLKKNNLLVIEFDKYGIVQKKDFYDIKNMKNISFAKNITENEISKENFIVSFLSSVRQKMQSKRRRTSGN